MLTMPSVKRNSDRPSDTSHWLSEGCPASGADTLTPIGVSASLNDFRVVSCTTHTKRNSGVRDAGAACRTGPTGLLHQFSQFRQAASQSSHRHWHYGTCPETDTAAARAGTADEFQCRG